MEDVFTMDHGMQLSDRILAITRQYDLELDQMAKVENVPRGAISMGMSRLYAERNAQIDLACLRMMGQMNSTVAHFQRIAVEAVNRYPGPARDIAPGSAGPMIELYPQPKPGETITITEQPYAMTFYSRLPMPPSDGADDGITDWKEQYRSDFGEATMMDHPDLSWEQRYKLKWLDATTSSPA
jgi:hypothetical protein